MSHPKREIAKPKPTLESVDAKVERLTKVVEGRLMEASQALAVIESYEFAQSRSGPLPDAEEFGRYDPQAQEVILRMAESDQRHRHDMDREDLRLSARGLAFGFGIAIFALGCATVLAMYDKEVAASVIGGASLFSLVGLFLKFRLQPPMPMPTPPPPPEPKSDDRKPAKN